MKTDTMEMVGNLLGPEAARDAIHVAVEPATAAGLLEPGAPVKLVTGPGGEVVAEAAEAGDAIGIVDPFLREMVFKGARFFIFLFPRTITSLRHVWTHPAFEAAGEATPEGPTAAPARAGKIETLKWLRDYAKRIDVKFEELVRRAAAYVDGGDGMEVATWVAWDTPDLDLFWGHIEALTGKKVRDEAKPWFFVCEC